MKCVVQKKQRYRATIAGKTYTILGTKSHRHMHSVISLLNREWDELTRAASTLGETERAILLAVNAVSLQLEKQAEIERLEREIERLTHKEHDVPQKRTGIAQEKKAQLEKQLAAQEELLRK